MGKTFLAATAVAGIVLSAQAALAGEVLVEGLGLWGAGTPTTPYSAAGKSFTYSFDLTNPYSYTSPKIGASETLDYSDFIYSLNGTPVATPLKSLEFYTVALGGGLNLNFATDSVSIYGADIGSAGTLASPALYSTTEAINGTISPSDATGSSFLTVTNANVPEPSAWALMLIGVGGLGAALRKRRRGLAAVA